MLDRQQACRSQNDTIIVILLIVNIMMVLKQKLKFIIITNKVYILDTQCVSFNYCIRDT